MKNIIFIALLIAGMATACAQTQSYNAEDLPPAKERAEFQTQFMKEKLALSDEQVPKVMEINLKMAKEVDKIMQMDDRRAKFNAYRKAQLQKDEQLKAILTNEQYKAYEKSKDEMKKKMKEKRKEKDSK